MRELNIVNDNKITKILWDLWAFFIYRLIKNKNISSGLKTNQYILLSFGLRFPFFFFIFEKSSLSMLILMRKILWNPWAFFKRIFLK